MCVYKAASFMSSWNAADLVIYIGVQTIRCPPTKYVSLLYYFMLYCLWQKCTPDKILSHLHVLLWSPYGIGRPYIFSCCGLFFLLLLSSSFFSSPNLSRRRLDVCHTSTHGVALVRI